MCRRPRCETSEYTKRAYWPWSPICVYCTRTQLPSLSSVLAQLSVLATLQMCWLQHCLWPCLLNGLLTCALGTFSPGWTSWLYAAACHLDAPDAFCLWCPGLPYYHLALPTTFWSYRAVFLTEGIAYPVVTLMSWLSFPEGAVGHWCFQAQAVFRNFDSEMTSCKKSFSKKAGKKDLSTDEPFHTLLCSGSFHLITFPQLYRKSKELESWRYTRHTLCLAVM